MASFMSNFFQGGKDKSAPGSPRPVTPTKKTNSFINPTSTPQGSPSKKTVPPGAHDLPDAFESAMTLGPESPVKLTRPQSVVTPLSPGKTNAQPLDESSVNIDDSIIHKTTSAGNQLQKQGQENTPPASRLGLGLSEGQVQHSHAAKSRQQLYEAKDRPMTPHKKFNTSRGLTAEEREILQKPNIKRLVNVTQLCMLHARKRESRQSGNVC